MMIEVAHILAGAVSERSVRFVASTNEEQPHFYTDTMGSQQYARCCRRRGENIVGMICLEMVGYYSTVPASQRVPDIIPRPITIAFLSGGILSRP